MLTIYLIEKVFVHTHVASFCIELIMHCLKQALRFTKYWWFCVKLLIAWVGLKNLSEIMIMWHIYLFFISIIVTIATVYFCLSKVTKTTSMVQANMFSKRDQIYIIFTLFATILFLKQQEFIYIYSIDFISCFAFKLIRPKVIDLKKDYYDNCSTGDELKTK
jgi:hypothetical protein